MAKYNTKIQIGTPHYVFLGLRCSFLGDHSKIFPEYIFRYLTSFPKFLAQSVNNFFFYGHFTEGRGRRNGKNGQML